MRGHSLPLVPSAPAGTRRRGPAAPTSAPRPASGSRAAIHCAGVSSSPTHVERPAFWSQCRWRLDAAGGGALRRRRESRRDACPLRWPPAPHFPALASPARLLSRRALSGPQSSSTARSVDRTRPRLPPAQAPPAHFISGWRPAGRPAMDARHAYIASRVRGSRGGGGGGGASQALNSPAELPSALPDPTAGGHV